MNVAVWQRNQAMEAEGRILEDLGDYMTINDVSAGEIARFRDACQSVYSDQARTIGEDVVNAWVEAVK